mgnify:CR=1 FL=1
MLTKETIKVSVVIPCYNEEEVLKKVYNIYNTVERILTESKATGKPEGVIAEEFAEDCIWGRR